MFLTLDQFLAHFPPMDLPKEEFADRFTIMYSKPQSLTQIFNQEIPPGRKTPIIRKSDDKRLVNRDRVIEYFYEILIRNRYKYLELFYNSYFQFKHPSDLKWNTPKLLSHKEGLEDPVISLQKNDASRRMIRNLYYLELLDLTRITNTVKYRVSFWQSLVNMYNRLELEDRFFAPSSIDLFLRAKGTKREQESGVAEINYHNLFYLFQSYQPKASIFNPYTIKWTLENVIRPHIDGSVERMFTPVLSWSCYLTAFMHLPYYRHYVGVDVMPSVCKKTNFLADWYQSNVLNRKIQVETYCTPSQNLLQDSQFLQKYADYFDTIMVCPAYFDMEIYHEGEQSIDTFPDYKDWLEGYWGATVELCYRVCRKGGVFAVIGNDYQTLDKKIYPLTTDLHNVVTGSGFQYLEKYWLQNRTSPLRAAGKARTERLFLYKKT